ncbi:Zn(II)2Cys6 transcription factor [Aspergillus saccharolyticus JOP 1030-1]|uniref:C6 transcription factor (Acr-2) n=1 Tax=Aspergillus saccharolyticus JOP 1030-1 TaxID=1450539 RepID=A0A318ZWM9_9EURO|nr:C6 transcription factor (Acr-2) [Aspergillus saccharolyticus JOP 1030-1]PYH48713.1 C6 transcription factor (Acr-2) [Aspergillus saccharolyticus JOP 1030-1]
MTLSQPCYTCRYRRVQCDLSARPCAKCTKAGVECLEKRPIRWVKGISIRGKRKGVSLSQLAEAPSAESAIIPFLARPKLSREDISKTDDLAVPLGLGDPSLCCLDSGSKYYLSYYEDCICSLFIVYDSDHNPFRKLLSLALSDSTLLKAALALAARHRANLGQSFQAYDEESLPTDVSVHQDALAFKHRAIRAISSALSDPTLCAQDTTVASVFLLIFLDLLESGSDRWNFHLEGAKKLIKFSQQQPGRLREAIQGSGQTLKLIRDFINSQIYLIETLGATFVRPHLLTDSSPLEPERVLCRETEMVEQSFLGCPEYLLMAIRCISLSRDSVHDCSNNEALEYHKYNVAAVVQMVADFDCMVWAVNLPRFGPAAENATSDLSMLAMSYKLGAQIYGQRVLDTLSNTETSLAALLAQLMQSIATLRDSDNLLKCALWPICIAGLECQVTEEQEFLIRSLEQFWESTKCVNVINAAKILQRHWQDQRRQSRISSSWIVDIGRSGRDWLLI